MEKAKRIAQARPTGCFFPARFTGLLNIRCCLLGTAAGAAATVALVARLIETNPLALVFLGVLVLLAVFARPVLLRHVKTERKA